MIKYLLYILFLATSVFSSVNSVYLAGSQVKQTFEELNTQCNVCNFLSEEFADETDDDSNKHIVYVSRIFRIVHLTSNKPSGLFIKCTSENFLLLNNYLDLPPPVIS